jgi:hypothetical protein
MVPEKSFFMVAKENRRWLRIDGTKPDLVQGDQTGRLFSMGSFLKLGSEVAQFWPLFVTEKIMHQFEE